MVYTLFNIAKANRSLGKKGISCYYFNNSIVLGVYYYITCIIYSQINSNPLKFNSLTKMQVTKLKQLILDETKALDNNSNPSNIIGILYNLIFLKHKIDKEFYQKEIYIHLKTLIDNQIYIVNKSNYGYDSFDRKKLIRAINLLPNSRKEFILRYLLSKTIKELPEFETEWIYYEINKNKLNIIFNSKNIKNIPKAFFLFSSLGIKNLFLSLLFFITIVYVILLPAKYQFFTVFKVEYYEYSDIFMFNHLLNILSLFSAIDNGFKISPINPFGLIIIIISKVLFISIIVNFIYKRISDNITVL